MPDHRLFQTHDGKTPADPPIPRKEMPLKAPFTEKVTVKIWASVDGKKGFLNPIEGVQAHRRDGKEHTLFTLHHTFLQQLKNGDPDKGEQSEITDKDGVTWLVVKVSQTKGAKIAHCTRKP